MLASDVAGNDVKCSNSVIVCGCVTSPELYRIPLAWTLEREPSKWWPDVFSPLLK